MQSGRQPEELPHLLRSYRTNLSGLPAVTTAELIRLLYADEEKPWATLNRGCSITPRQVAKRLKEYGIISHTIRIGIETAKGYAVEQFSPPEISVTTSQANTHAVLSVTDNLSRFGNDMQNVTRKPATSAVCDVVTDKILEKEAKTYP